MSKCMFIRYIVTKYPCGSEPEELILVSIQHLYLTKLLDRYTYIYKYTQLLISAVRAAGALGPHWPRHVHRPYKQSNGPLTCCHW